MKVVYADSVLLINGVINYLILLLTARICDICVKRLRLILSAAAGGLYALLSELPPLAFLLSPFLKVSVAVLMALIAFPRRRLIRPLLIFLAVSAAFAGAVMALGTLAGEKMGSGGVYIYGDLRILVLAFAACYCLMALVLRRAGKRAAGGYAGVEVRQGQRRVRFNALYDTGSSLSDPVTGERVMVAEGEELLGLFSGPGRRIIEDRRKLEPDELFLKLSAAEHKIKFRLIPYSALGTSGLLVAMKPDYIGIDGVRQEDLLIAISPTDLSDGGPYSAVFNI